MPASELARLESIAKSLASSLPKLFLALVYVAFSRLSGNRELVLGFTIHNRTDKAFRRTMGLAAANVPCGLDIDPASSFRAALHQIDVNFLRDLQHARFPVGQLSSSLGLPRIARRHIVAARWCSARRLSRSSVCGMNRLWDGET